MATAMTGQVPNPLALLRTMVLSKEGDRREGILSRQGKGWFQVSATGHEALAALGDLLSPEDFLFPHYRDRALLLARGLETLEFAHIFFAKRAGSSGGRQIPGHYSCRRLNVWSMGSPTGSNLLPAAGAAWGMKLDGHPSLTLASVGDGGMRQGEFYEALAFALERQLPLVFLVEDNQFAISTFTGEANPLRRGLFSDRVVVRGDGRTPESVRAAGREAFERARSGGGPVVLWLEFDRLCSHSSADDHRNYRSPDDIRAMNEREPCRCFAEQLIAQGLLSEDAWAELQRDVQSAVEEAYRRAEHAADPDPAEIHRALIEPHGDPPHVVSLRDEDGACRMVDAVNQTFRHALETDPRHIFFGEDIADPMGGVFKLTAGLSSAYPDRVFNAPLAEATILGVACGLASYGKRPVAELQFVDFVGPAWNQLVNNLATLRWRSFGEWSCPLVIYAPSGAYLPGGGPWHSQSAESAFAQIPGLRVCVPSTPEDAAGLMATALRSADPTIVLLPKHLLRVRRALPEVMESVPFGKARIRQAGADVTAVAWGNGLEKVEAAVQSLGDEVSVEIIDLRTVQPWDKECVFQSVRKTRRLLVVHEDNRSCSVGQMIIAECLADSECWRALLRPPVLVAREDVHIGYHPTIEYASLPSEGAIVSALRSLTQAQQPPADLSQLLIRRPLVPTAPPPPQQSPAPAAPVSHTDVPIVLPALGEGLEEARVIEFLKQPGDAILRDEIIYRIETDKAIVDIEAPEAGVLHAWRVEPDALVKIGTVVGVIRATHRVASPALALAPAPAPRSAAPHDRSREGTNGTPNGHCDAPLAEPRPPALDPMASGIPSPDSDPAEPLGNFEDIQLSERQQALASRLVRASHVAIPATIMQEISWEPIAAAREALRLDPRTEHVTSFSLVTWAVVRALCGHRAFRSFLPNYSVLRIYKHVNLGIAVSLPNDELTTAVVERADELDLLELAAAAKRQIELARKNPGHGRQKASLILTSMTAFHIQQGIPVIVPPAVATLLICTPHSRVILGAGNKPCERQFVNLSLTFDHRVINGVGAAAFLNDVKRMIEEFDLAEVWEFTRQRQVDL